MASRRASRKSPPAPSELKPVDRPWLLLIGIVLATLAAYQPAWHGGMLWDDDAHLTPAALASWSGLSRIWTDFTVTQQYYPIVNTAFWSMNRLWGHDPLGYHLVNILLHALSAMLVVVILRRWSVPGAAIAGVVFALHPVQVESVAWMTELKNTLSGVFYLLAVAAYARFDTTRSRRWYIAALAAFLFALASKTVTATLPAALLIILWWQRGHIRMRRDVAPLVPFFAAGAVAGIGTAWLEVAWVGAKGAAFDLTFVERVLLAGRAAWFYALKLVVPLGLVFSYPRWTIDQASWWQYLFPGALAGALMWLWAIRGRSRAPLAAVLFFLATLFPALGFVNVFPFRYSYVADHFQYLACLGLIVLFAAGIARAVAAWRPALPEATLVFVVGAPLLGLTFLQSHQYADAATLYRATLASNPSSLLARNNLAGELLNGPASGWPEAIVHAEAAVAIDPDDAEAHNNLGLARQRQGRHADSVREYREAIRLKPDLAAAHYNLAIGLAELGQLDESIAAYEASLRIFPNQPEALHNLANVLARVGRQAEALSRRREAARLAPGSGEIQMNLANALLTQGDYDGAIAAYGNALRTRPDWGEAHHNLGTALRRAGRTREAAAEFEHAARLMPGVSLVEFNWAGALVALEKLADAVPHFERALASPDSTRAADIHNQFGVVLVRLGRVDAAIVQFEAAVALRPGDAALRDNLLRARRSK